jgi:hypothetical protein
MGTKTTTWRLLSGLAGGGGIRHECDGFLVRGTEISKDSDEAGCTVPPSSAGA